MGPEHCEHLKRYKIMALDLKTISQNHTILYTTVLYYEREYKAHIHDMYLKIHRFK